MKNFEKLKKEQIKFYTNLLYDDEILLLKSSDEYYKNHYIGSPLNVLTNFSGTEGKAIIEKTGKITIFVDTRYHILAEKHVYPDIEIYKMQLSESFFDAFRKKYRKNTKMFVPDDILLSEYLKYDEYFDLRKYSLPEKYLKNHDLDETKKIFSVDKNIEKNDFLYKVEKYKTLNPDIKRILIFNLDAISYFTNLRSFKSNYSSNFESILYLDFEKSFYVLFIKNVEQAKKINIEKLKITAIDEFYDFINLIDLKIHIKFEDISLNKFLSIKNPVQIKKNNLELLISIKPVTVIEHLKEVSEKLDFAILNFKNKLKTGLSEADLANIFEKELIKAGAIAPSFKTILAINENSASIHYSSYDKNKILTPESIILLDCGGYYEAGYATDITRTFYFGNSPKPIHKKIYTQVLKAFLNCYLSSVTSAYELDFLARKILSPLYSDGFNFDHGLGHGIGTSVHQNPPGLSPSSKDIIKPYQTHSIEPGLYGRSLSDGEEFGIRIENCVYFDIDYNRISLSKFPFEEILIDYNLLSINEIETVKKWQKEFECKYQT